MKTASSAMQAHLQQGQTTLAWILKVKRADGTIYGFTTHDQDIVYDNGDGDGAVTYQAKTALKNSGESNKSDLSVDNLEVLALLDSTSISEVDLRAHLFDDAVIQVRVVNWADLTMGDVYMRKGTLGVVKMINGQFTAELRGLSYRLSTPIGVTTGPLCRAEFGSGLNGIDVNSKYLCKVDVTQYRQTGAVISMSDARTINIALTSNLATDPGVGLFGGWYNDGILTFTSGALTGQTFEIKTGDFKDSGRDTQIALYIDILGTLPAGGDTFTIEAGCDKTVFKCFNNFNNMVNFRGEPQIPGEDSILDYPNATS